MPQGKVKWFNNAKGYGFIIEDGDSEDLFAHFSAIQMEGYKTLKAGERVSFDKEPSAKGIHAVNIVPLDRPAGGNGRSADASRETAQSRKTDPLSATGATGSASEEDQEAPSGKPPGEEKKQLAQSYPGSGRVHSAMSS